MQRVHDVMMHGRQEERAICRRHKDLPIIAILEGILPDFTTGFFPAPNDLSLAHEAKQRHLLAGLYNLVTDLCKEHGFRERWIGFVGIPCALCFVKDQQILVWWRGSFVSISLERFHRADEAFPFHGTDIYGQHTLQNINERIIAV